ncbi:homoserine dehydrogenase [Candidatus Formimonas warabiya]|uniref:Homoserine dehydrogenase n=1 Tax=Formimonas warabiya TaxID=1761012 RepID=A0A3G1KPP8_FORW1|nr:homoserine dehydrogenase [Candidatus Formimonas warabiya]ATW24115.1 homoserine dehydrogenase [Candidatus Formimonas warabiya]
MHISQRNKINIGIMGMGTVGTGVVKVLLENKETISRKVDAHIEIRKILDQNTTVVLDKIQAFDLPADVLTDQAKDLLDDPEIDIIVEVLGGIQPAKDYMIRALENGKSVVTANKDLIAAHGKELFDVAALHDVDLFFEASVAGGIPIIQSLKESLAGNHIKQIMGIVNGTTNFILTKMSEEGKTFDEVLAQAQALGYAEADPTADVGGFDAARKVAILASIAFNTRITDAAVFVEGITKISHLDITYAKELGYTIKLLGITKEIDGEVEVRVHPAMIPISHPLSSVKDAFNAVFVEGDAVGKTMFYGRGAGELPTASAVVGDIISASRNIQFSSRGRLGCTCFEHKRIRSIGEIKTKFYLRMVVKDRPGVLASIAAVLGNQNVSIATVIQKRIDEKGRAEIVLITHLVEERHFRDAIAVINGLSSVENIESIIRVEDAD